MNGEVFRNNRQIPYKVIISCLIYFKITFFLMHKKISIQKLFCNEILKAKLIYNKGPYVTDSTNRLRMLEFYMMIPERIGYFKKHSNFVITTKKSIRLILTC